MAEQKLVIDIPSVCEALYMELKTTPFYKTDKGYQFASYLLSATETETTVRKFLSDPDQICEIGVAERTEIRNHLQETLDALSSLVVSDTDLTLWITSSKAAGDVAKYHQILESFIESLMVIELKARCFSSLSDFHEPTEAERKQYKNTNGPGFEFPENCQIRTFKDISLTVSDLNGEYEKVLERHRQAGSSNSNTVLNHRNPFADISIKEQQFLFGSDYGQFEALGLATNHTLTMVPKTTEQSYLVLQPGFKIRKTKDLEDSKKNLVLFDDTISTEVTQSDDNIYVYIE